MKKISTSALAKKNWVSGKELLEFLEKNDFIKIKKKWIFSSDLIKVLTILWKENWWELKTWTKYWDYIVWPEDFDPYKKLNIENIKYMSVTELSKIFNVSAKKLNLVISEIGWMESTIKWWKLTKLWESIWWKEFVYEKTGKEYIRWTEVIIENTILKDSLNSDTQPDQKAEITDKELEFRKKFPPTCRAKDWHNVRSRGEMLIDNALYEFKLVHAYERKVPIQESMYTDFYLPPQRWGKGVYIEYWGYENEEKYLKRKK